MTSRWPRAVAGRMPHRRRAVMVSFCVHGEDWKRNTQARPATPIRMGDEKEERRVVAGEENGAVVEGMKKTALRLLAAKAQAQAALWP